MSTSIRSRPSGSGRLSVGAALALCVAGAIVPAHASAAPPQPGVPIASFTLPDGNAGGVPTISSHGGTVAWSSPTSAGRWGLRVAAGDVGDLGANFSDQPWPVDVSVGSVHGAPVVYFSQCSKHTTAKSRATAGGCNIVELPELTSGARPVAFKAAATSRYEEYAPTRWDDHLVYARWTGTSGRSSLVEYDVATKKTRTLPAGRNGNCKDCAKSGLLEGGPLETGLYGERYATLWQQNGGTDSFGIGPNDTVLQGIAGTRNVHLFPSDAGGPSVVSGTCGSIQYGSVQVVGTVTQSVRRLYDCDATPTRSLDTVQRVTRTGDVSEYADPTGRRIVSASADGQNLWEIVDARPLTDGQRHAANAPSECTAAVGGCQVVMVQRPDFEPVKRSA